MGSSLADQFAAVEFRIVVIDHQGSRLGERERLLHQLGEFAVDDQHLGFGMIELERITIVRDT